MSDPISAIKDLRPPPVEDAHLRGLRRKTRALMALGASNAAVIHARDEDELLHGLCRAVVDIAGYRMAWIGWAQQDEHRSVRPAAWAGSGADYVAAADVRWDQGERGRGPTGRCIRTGRPQVASDLETDPAMAPWREQARRADYRSSVAVPVRVADSVGTLNIYAAEPDAFDADEMNLLLQMTDELCFGLATLRLREAHARVTARLEGSMEQIIQVVAAACELRDPNMPGHQRRVSDVAAAIAGELGFDDERIRGLRIAASIHDIGKVHTPEDILALPRRLTAAEFEIVKRHSEDGYQMLKDIDLPWPVAAMVRQHHERVDGSGYPHGLRGDAILPEARILAVADVLEAIATQRPYRLAYGVEHALEVLASRRGTEYDAMAVDALLRLVREKGYVIPA